MFLLLVQEKGAIFNKIMLYRIFFSEVITDFWWFNLQFFELTMVWKQYT